MSIALLLANVFLTGSLAQVPPDAPKPAPCPPTADGDRHRQAGCPRAVAWWAIPSDGRGFMGYQLGGGCPCPGLADAPRPGEGTWGWDYVGAWFPRDVLLGWWHERSPQGGTYRTDVRADK